MDNGVFLDVIKQSFSKFIAMHSRSNEKLKILHGKIASDLAQRLGSNYTIQSLGFGNEKEGVIAGRYIDKNVDIVVYDNKNKVVAGIGVKFMMQNYTQNSNNYFENMLGETANIQCNKIPYFQIFIIPDNVPYYDKDGIIKKWERFNHHNVQKYLKLSEDNPDIMLHAPTKTLFYIVSISTGSNITTNSEYKEYYLNNAFTVTNSDVLSDIKFGNGVILNDYTTFIEKTVHRILSI